jgi:hypothetical protein
MDPEATEEEYDEVIRLQDLAGERAFSEKPAEPFLVEPFCAQVAWMGKACPVYPFTAAKPKDVCRFLTAEGYENYRCPINQDPPEIYKGIYERGTIEQKKALEHLADMSVRYAQNPVEAEAKMCLVLTHYRPLGEAIGIYKSLGLEEKAKTAEAVWDKITTVKIEPKK